MWKHSSIHPSQFQDYFISLNDTFSPSYLLAVLKIFLTRIQFFLRAVLIYLHRTWISFEVILSNPYLVTRRSHIWLNTRLWWGPSLVGGPGPGLLAPPNPALAQVIGRMQSNLNVMSIGQQHRNTPIIQFLFSLNLLCLYLLPFKTFAYYFICDTSPVIAHRYAGYTLNTFNLYLWCFRLCLVVAWFIYWTMPVSCC